MELRQIQKEQDAWAKENFDNKKPYQAILGVTEEIGELAHSYLKMEQGIRGSKEKHIELMKDAVGDSVIFLMDFCNQMDFDLQDLVEGTWDEVKKRNWKKDSQTAGTNVEAIQQQ
ncbi:MAG: NTP pyrophosphatase (non-canonical NTP hydrolase) [Candidatus Omnitrophota bacterium]|jgi:NTP pyrophosphatase (non-canonical NTP hydrolase)